MTGAPSRLSDRAVATRTSRLGAVRRVLERLAPPRLRLVAFRLAAHAFPSRVGPEGFLRLAAELREAGRIREAMLCWRIIHGMAPMDTRVARERVTCAVEAGDMAEVDQALQDATSGAGLPPPLLVGIAGQLAQHGEMQAVTKVLERLGALPSADRLVMQSPSVVSSELLGSIGALIDALESKGASCANQLQLARLCFAFRNPRPAVALFDQASEVVELQALDRAAMLHALCETDPAALTGVGPELSSLVDQLSTSPEALGLLVKPAVLAGELEVAREALVSAMRLRHGSAVEGLTVDCLAILEVLAELRAVDDRTPTTLLERVEDRAGGVPKVFLSGFGWSGSGALYDEIRGAPGFCEFEGAGYDVIINEDAESEVTFVQGPGGLGDIWAHAVRYGCVPWSVLWNTLNLHVAGLSSIGYAQYKCAAAARNHLDRYGDGYTRPFVQFMKEYRNLKQRPSHGGLHACLLDATESLCSMLMRGSDGRAVLFNNAIFGRDAVMFEIFRGRRVAVVYRDPRDVYVDRRNKDLNHWRTPEQLATYYAEGLRRYAEYKLDRGAGDTCLREVPFERFVKNDRFRARVREWLLGELIDAPRVRHFDPVVSRRNIGIHVGALTHAEHAQLEGGLEHCRRLDRISDAVWGAGA